MPYDPAHPKDSTCPEGSADRSTAPLTEFVADCYRWFGVDFTPDSYPHLTGSVEVARVSIDLDESDHLEPRQREWDPDPVTQLILVRRGDGRLDSYTCGDCEFYGDSRYALKRLGELALAAGVITGPEWDDLVHEDELDLLNPPRQGPPRGRA